MRSEEVFVLRRRPDARAALAHLGEDRTLGARRDIAAGEELTLDYALVTVSPAWRMECHCGAAECRGGVTGNDWQLRSLQHVYAGHFSPFINARISVSALRRETV